MKPAERENSRYSKGAENRIELEERILFSLLPACPETGGRRLLDIGCGVGTIALELQRRGFRVTGIDFSKVAVDKCLARGVDAVLSDVDQDGLRFPDGSFDVAWAGDVIEHVFDPLYLFEEIARVLKDDGCLLLTTPNNFGLAQRVRILLTGESIQSETYRSARQCKHHTFFSWELLQYMLSQGRFSVDALKCICRTPITKREVTVGSAVVGSLFGRAFIVRARKCVL